VIERPLAHDVAGGEGGRRLALQECQAALDLLAVDDA
jgi:hypothetical protein